MFAKTRKPRLPAASVVSKYARLVVVTVTAIFFMLQALAGHAADSGVHKGDTRQINSQVNRLIAVLKDEYAEEAPHDRQVQFIDVSNFGKIAIAAFIIEGFGGGNNVHQFMAVFGPPDGPGPKSLLPYYALSALTEIGDECAVDVRSVRASAIRRDGSLALTLPTFLTSTTGSCEGKTRSYILRTNEARLQRLELR
ncbi:hypothetical protein OKW43_000263 [Paraburkholderia sp. WC7.3g]|uniref:Uncharacterized protein n=1 Tax=Paraburkholderia podalyriae TaxID=1938811 RepID=A0ABR7PU97_9BURK|nr:hypothetical protein [Paraburkholderia podalyriae]MBC8749845.1 hypothetical protein [Paraburkholderia podalyriae]